MSGRRTLTLGFVLLAGSLAGCVDRRFVITSDPPGAVVLRNNQPIGATPADDHFVYYGNYHFTLIKDGYSTLQVDQEVPTPWYEYIPLDFISENIVPWKVTDVRRFTYRLEPIRNVNTDDLLNRAQNLRNRGQSIGAPVPYPVLPAAAPAPAAPPGTAPPAAPPPATAVVPAVSRP